MLFHMIVIISGLLVSLHLFYRFPMLETKMKEKRNYTISVIIPARNEEVNLKFLLQDLTKQVYRIHEIICVDDCSLDNTANVASSFDVTLITITNKPADWIGKAWACQKGSEIATGELLLFLDADVRLHPDAISCLMQTYDESQCVVSVQPYHQTVERYEQLSLFFNLIQVAANGTSTFANFKKAGLYGPVILISKTTYLEIDGHLSAKNSIVDDLALGETLRQKGFKFKLFLGGDYISFRMYGGGMLDLLRGWMKNYATGAIKTPLLLFAMVFLWVTSCTSVVLSLLQTIYLQQWIYVAVVAFLYIVWILELSRIARNIGNFKQYTLIFFPVAILLFLWVFVISVIKKLFHLNVVWKDRKIKLER